MGKCSLLSCFVLCFLLGCHKEKPEKLLIATSANMQYAIDSLMKAFTKEKAIRCEKIIGSSGKLTAQIKEGAPFDIFLSANMKYPESLYKDGLTLKPPRIYAHGKLVLWTTDKQIRPSIAILKSQFSDHIAIANPKIAPYGNSAHEVLHHYNIYDAVESKLISAESISQVNQFISLGTAKMGFTSKSVVLSQRDQYPGAWIEIDPESYSPIQQGIVILKNNSTKTSAAEKFEAFLFSDTAKRILDKFGYQLPEK